DAQPHPAGRADDHQRHDQHGREDRALDADFGELLHGGLRDHGHGLAADEVPRTRDHRVAALEPVDDLDVLAEPAAGRHANLGALALANDQHLLDTSEHDNGARRDRDYRLAPLGPDVAAREGARA